MVSMSLSGDLNILDPNSDKLRTIIKGHNKNITALAVVPSSNNFYTGSYDGIVNRWDATNAVATSISGKGHTNAIVSLHLVGSDIVSAGMDDSVRVTPSSSLAYAADKTATDGLPADIGVGKSGLAVVATVNAVQVVRGGKVVGSVKLADNTAVAVSPDESTVIVGSKSGKLTVYSLAGNNITQKAVLEGHRGAVTRIAYSQDGSHFASGDTNRELLIWAAGGSSPKHSGLVFHSARINDVAWAPDNVHVASVSLDQSIIIWNINDINSRIVQKQAHVGGVNGARWLDANTLVTIGQDSSAKTWVAKW